MAKNDELDEVLSDRRIEAEEWQAFGEILEIKDILKMSMLERQKVVNRKIRHSYGHAFANAFRDEYEPDYVKPILLDVANKVKATITTYRTEEIEDAILVKVIEIARDKIIKERGQAEWDRIEKEIQDQIEELIRMGKVPQSAVQDLLKLRGGALVAALIGGRLAGFALYIVANQVFFAIARFLGIRVGVAVAGPIIGEALAAILGPAGWLIAGITVLYDLCDTDWEKVIPAVVLVAAIRKRLAFGF